MAHAGGRPPKFKTSEELEQKIAEYFAGGYRTRTIVIGNKRDGFEEKEIPDITISDLVIFLGFCDRASFYDYEKKPEFAHAIKRARSFIEREYESLLKLGNPAGAIFALKNFGWTDQLDLNQTGEITVVIKKYSGKATPSE